MYIYIYIYVCIYVYMHLGKDSAEGKWFRTLSEMGSCGSLFVWPDMSADVEVQSCCIHAHSHHGFLQSLLLKEHGSITPSGGFSKHGGNPHR